MKFLTILGLVSAASAHTVFTTLFINGKHQGDGTCVRMPLDDATATGPIRPVTGDDMACNRDGGKPVAYTCPAPGKATLTFVFRMYPSGQQDGAIDISHMGPCAVYVKKVDDMYKDSAAGGGWFKIWEDGLNEKTGEWCVARLIAQKGLLSVDLPAGLPRGFYLVRPEILALQNVVAANDPQFYTGCAQIYVQDGPEGKLDVPAEFQATIPGYVKMSDPGLTYNIYNEPLLPYSIPGPKVYIPSGSAGAGAGGGNEHDVSPPPPNQPPNDFNGAVPKDCVIKNANWCAKPLDKYTAGAGCWAATKQCYDQSEACWKSAPPSGNANCKVWQDYCKGMEEVCGAAAGGRDVSGPPPFKGEEHKAKVPGEIPKPWGNHEQSTGRGGDGKNETAVSSVVPSSAASPTPSSGGAGYGPEPTASKTSTDGRCGGEEGQTCRGSAYGSCCSSMNWCGRSRWHCGQGCQSGFGECK
ncbi:hypothetical protein JDV02_000192 [Purpureocillium takamizusanense]|uniref:lytic cellulose monooxygenase (C4-dehydrogenating) n=1 Tax=Purpureocillium takamizusanense TaxID=2060973 RepID=A0A9Q8V582_9HYPO|nr:uncharacterized protein JDV02_000192 [Purpureocillium takamizusanense]UNI13445.1 hypothetical protein JDV02_000192 [Purpureocillium takamizusanense]